MLRLTGGLSGLPAVDEPKKNGEAFSLSLLKNSNAEPLNSFVPDLVTTVIAAPPAMPCSASKLLVEMLTVSIVSAGEMFMLCDGSQMLTLVAPSVRVALLLIAWPLTLVASERDGVSVSAFCSAARRRARHQVQQRLVVAELVERQRRDLRCP